MMPRRLHLDLALPDEVFMQLRDEEIARKIKEALVMALLREHHISQGQAAETLGVDRHELFGLIRRHPVPVVDLTPEELKAELQKPFPRSYG